MIVAMIEDCTRTAGKKQGYIGLPLRDGKHDGDPTMTSAWELTPDEIMAIMLGAKIEITIMGTVHPPISVNVGGVPGVKAPG